MALLRNPLLPAVALAITLSVARAYPPDNAAILYYKASMTYKQPEGELATALADVAAGKTPPTQEVINFIRGQTEAIKTVTDAAQIQLCDWGCDYTQGIAIQLPVLSHMRSLARIVLADAAIQADEGRWDAAIQRCRTAYGMAQHVKTDRLVICNLVGIAIERLAHDNLTRILAHLPPDADRLNRIDALLTSVQNDSKRMRESVEFEAEKITRYTSPEQLQASLQSESKGHPALEWTPETLEKSRRYYLARMKDLAGASDLPYAQGTERMRAIEEQLQKDVEAKRSEAALAAALIPAISKCFSTETLARTHTNALRNAVAIYRVRAAQGKLPQNLPPDCPKDLFSGQAFDYQVTDEGFTLRCRGRDLNKDTVHEYKFAVQH